MSAFLGFEALRDLVNIVTAHSETAREYKDAVASQDEVKALRRAVKAYGGVMAGGGSIIQLSRKMLVEPVFTVSEELRAADNIDTILNTLNGIFAAHYAQAINYVANINAISRAVNVNQFASYSSESEDVFEGIRIDNLSQESGLLTLPISNSQPVRQYMDNALSTEAGIPKTNPRHEQYIRMKNAVSAALKEMPKEEAQKQKGFTTNVNVDLSKLPSRVTGLNVTIDISAGDRTIKMPFIVRATDKFAPWSVILEMLDLGGSDKHFTSRWHMARSGGISYVRDFIFARDLIREYRKLRVIKDTNKVIESVRKRANKTAVAVARGKDAPFGGLYAGTIITSEQAAELEMRVRDKLSHYKTRQQIFDGSSSTFLVIVDQEWERVTFYTRDLDGSMDIGFKALENKKSSTNIEDIFKAFRSGTQSQL